MEKREEQLRAEIHEVQGQLAETLEALGEKVSPRQVVEQTKAKARDKLDDVADKVSPPSVARRQVEKLKDKLDRESDDAGAGQVDDGTRQRIAEAARRIEAQEGHAR